MSFSSLCICRFVAIFVEEEAEGCSEDAKTFSRVPLKALAQRSFLVFPDLFSFFFSFFLETPGLKAEI